MLTDPLLRGAIDERMIAAMRLMLALLALLSTYIDPAETTHYVAATYTVLVFYLAYSLTLLTLAVRRRSTIPAAMAYWADVGWDILLIGSSMGTNSIFFFFLLWWASFQRGSPPGCGSRWWRPCSSPAFALPWRLPRQSSSPTVFC